MFLHCLNYLTTQDFNTGIRKTVERKPESPFTHSKSCSLSKIWSVFQLRQQAEYDANFPDDQFCHCYILLVGGGVGRGAGFVAGLDQKSRDPNEWVRGHCHIPF